MLAKNICEERVAGAPSLGKERGAHLLAIKEFNRAVELTAKVSLLRVLFGRKVLYILHGPLARANAASKIFPG